VPEIVISLVANTFSSRINGVAVQAKVRQIADSVAPQQIADATIADVHQQCSGGQLFDFPKMLNMLADAITVPSTEAQLQLSFEAFDKDRCVHSTSCANTVFVLSMAHWS
jgi:hypothetical protein